MCEKCLHSNYIQMLWEIFSVLIYFFSFVDVTLQVDALFDVVHSATGNREVPRTVSILTAVTDKKQNWSFLPVRRQLKLLLRCLRTSLLLLCLTSPNAQHLLCHTRVIGVFYSNYTCSTTQYTGIQIIQDTIQTNIQ